MLIPINCECACSGGQIIENMWVGAGYLQPMECAGVQFRIQRQLGMQNDRW